jgi:hypothetical protein
MRQILLLLQEMCEQKDMELTGLQQNISAAGAFQSKSGKPMLITVCDVAICLLFQLDEFRVCLNILSSFRLYIVDYVRDNSVITSIFYVY